MAENNEPAVEWGRIAAQVAELWRLDTNRSPTLTRVLEAGVRRLEVTDGRKLLAFDSRALFIGFLMAGRGSPDEIRYGNAASWLVDWLSERLGPEPFRVRLETMRDSTPKVVFGVTNDYNLTLSESVQTVLYRAEGVAFATIGTHAFEARHVLAAMLLGGVLQDQVRLIFGVSLTEEDLTNFKLGFVHRIMETAGKDEQFSGWDEVFNLPPDAATAVSGSARPPTPPTSPPAPSSTPSSPSTPPLPPGSTGRPVDTVTTLNNDNIAATNGSDPLATAGDARAIARLMCLKAASPLAVAVFGSWGSGKSSFMSRLAAEVKTATEAAQRDKDDRFAHKVVQIRFNAWQFVDANLWASLTTELFEQLRVGGSEGAGAALHQELVERVSSHVPALGKRAEDKRQEAADSRVVADKAAKTRDEARDKASGALLEAGGRKVAADIGKLYSDQKHNLDRLGLSAGVGEAVDTILEAAKSIHETRNNLGAIVKFLSKSMARAAVASACLLLFVGFLVFTCWVLIDPQRRTDVLNIGVGFGGIASAIAAGFIAMRPAIKVASAIASYAANLAKIGEEAKGAAEKTLLKAEVDLRLAEADAVAKQRAAEAAAREHQRYVAPDGAAGQPRLLRYLLEVDPGARDMAAEVGIIGRARRLFQAVDLIVKEEMKKPPEQRLDGDVPERIVLYIDDLDRCTTEQVYNVLQAVHLLLAFDLFVVVVGVDVAWVQDALARSFGVEEEKEDTRRERAARYLDKIFQVAFWLTPLSNDGDDGGSFARYVRELTAGQTVEETSAAPEPVERSVGPPAKPAEAPSPADPAPAPAAPVAEAPAAEVGTSTLAGAAEDEAVQEAAPPPAPLATIALARAEVDFLASPTIARIAAKTPRGAKRLINVYRLVRTRLAETGAADPVAGALPDYPLFALMVALETGQPVEVADAFFDGLKGLGVGESLIQDTLFQPPEGSLQPPRDREPVHRLRTAYALCPALADAVKRVAGMRGQQLTAGEALRVAWIARRYSFNRYG